ncbi:MAG: DUF2799 domain-containing protein [Proteobacteria bacterium]|nr:DUF2799 domain-containing protein [Pseudomonadota bacterium]MDA1291289.1 DUF2799 domain-containing protein [Pseudomonadota bacterium]
MNSKRIVALSLIVIMLSGCAVMSEEECVYSDWTAVGYEDGADGRSSDRFGDYRRTCADQNITPDFQAWQAGREQGLIEFCQPLRGFQVGESGGYYDGVCNGNLEPGFLDAFRLGAELYSLRSDLNVVASRVVANTEAIQRIDSDVAGIESIIILDETTPAQRAQLLADMRELSEVKGELVLEAELLIEERTLVELALYEFEFTVIEARF